MNSKYHIEEVKKDRDGFIIYILLARLQGTSYQLADVMFRNWCKRKPNSTIIFSYSDNYQFQEIAIYK